MEDKTIFYSILGVIGIVVVCGLVFAISASRTGMVYGGGLNPLNPYPYDHGRTVQGGVDEIPGYVYPQQAVDVSKTSSAYENTQYSIFQNRYPPRTQTALTSCGGQEALTRAGYNTGVPYGYVLEWSQTEVENIYGYWNLNNYCVPAPHYKGKYCCKPIRYT